MNDDIKPKPRGKRWKRILKWTSGAILVALIAWTFITYWTSTNDCERYAAAPTNPMKAVVYCDYGVPNLKFQEIEKPTPADDQLLVKVRAASVNPLDWHFIEGTPYIMRAMGVGMRKPKETRLGVDFAGTVEAVGKNVTKFKPGDEVFGGRTGAFAEYVCVREARAVASKPASVTFEQAASVPIAGVTDAYILSKSSRATAEYLVTWFEFCYVFADGFYRAGKINAEPGLLWFAHADAHCAHDVRCAFNEVPVERINRGCANFYQKLIVGRSRLFDLLKLKIGHAVVAIHDSFHRICRSCSVALAIIGGRPVSDKRPCYQRDQNRT